MANIFNSIETARLIPVIALDHADDAGPLGDALLAGGLPLAEITFRTGAAETAIRTMTKRSDMLVGAGTVLDVDTAKRAVDAGAKFVVSPGFSSKVVEYCMANRIHVIPGTVTPTEIQSAIEHGLRVVKFFPAEAFGGIKTIKALAAPFGQIRFIPTGGISEKHLAEYLSFEPVLAVGGSWFVSKDLIAAKDFSQITRLTMQAIKAAREARP